MSRAAAPVARVSAPSAHPFSPPDIVLQTDPGGRAHLGAAEGGRVAASADVQHRLRRLVRGGEGHGRRLRLAPPPPGAGARPRAQGRLPLPRARLDRRPRAPTSTSRPARCTPSWSTRTARRCTASSRSRAQSTTWTRHGRDVRAEDVFHRLDRARQHYEAVGLGADYANTFVR